MKPPSRRRTEPSRFRLKSTEEEPTRSDKRTNVRSFCKGWTRTEQRSFLQALKRQKNFGSELDPTELQKNVPRRSLQEVLIPIKTSLMMLIHVDVFCNISWYCMFSDWERYKTVEVQCAADGVSKGPQSAERWAKEKSPNWDLGRTGTKSHWIPWEDNFLCIFPGAYEIV